MKKYDIFISYSRKDNNTAKQICSVLENYARHYKFEYFFDQDDIICRDEYLKRISSAISESKAMLFIASKNSYKSEFCAKELLFADKRGVRIHQYRIDDAEIPLDIDMLLGTHQYREAKSTSIENFVREVLADLLRCTIESLSSLKEKERVEYERRREEQLRQERAKRVEVIDSTIAKHNEELKSVDQHIIDCEKSLLELKYRRDRLNVTLKELKDERFALLSFLSKPGALEEEKVVVPEPTPDPVPEIEPTTYKVGDFYDDGKKQGVVFDVSDDGKHGKIISLDVTALRWCTLDGKSIGVTSKSDGQSNTDIVMSRSDYKNYPAFVWCREQGEDWYLPSKDELLSLYHVKNQINKLLRDRCKEMINDNWYWSSTERGLCAWFVDMNNGGTYNGNKFGNYYVRAVSAF